MHASVFYWGLHFLEILGNWLKQKCFGTFLYRGLFMFPGDPWWLINTKCWCTASSKKDSTNWFSVEKNVILPFHRGDCECFFKSTKSVAEGSLLLMLFLLYWKRKNGVAGTLTAEVQPRWQKYGVGFSHLCWMIVLSCEGQQRLNNFSVEFDKYKYCFLFLHVVLVFCEYTKGLFWGENYFIKFHSSAKFRVVRLWEWNTSMY